MATSRGSQMIEQVLGKAKPEVWISDCFSAQLKAPAKQRQLCLAQQLWNLQYSIDAERCNFCAQAFATFAQCCELPKSRDTISPPPSPQPSFKPLPITLTEPTSAERAIDYIIVILAPCSIQWATKFRAFHSPNYRSAGTGPSGVIRMRCIRGLGGPWRPGVGL